MRCTSCWRPTSTARRSAPWARACELLATLGIGAKGAAAPAGVVVAATPVTNLGDTTAAPQVASDFIAAIAKHRHWDRANVDAVPA